MAISQFFRQARALFGGSQAEQTAASPVPVFEASDPALLAMMSALLDEQKIKATQHETHLQFDNGLCLALAPQESHALSDSRCRSCVRIQCRHPLLFPEGLTEFQHALGKDEQSAVLEALKQWLNMDYPVLSEALKFRPDMTVIELPVAAQNDGAALYRQIILGPVAHLASQPERKKEEHPFCPCCLMTESMAVFHDLLQSQRFLGIRFFVSRDQQGQLAVDCRVNGEDFPQAQSVLLAYAEKWPQRGLEFRKQYVIVRTSGESVHKAGDNATQTET